MKVEVHEIGQSRSRVVVIDDFFNDPQRVVGAASALAPFPPEGDTAYPGQRRQIGPGDAASGYVFAALQSLVPIIRDGFGAESFGIVEASFSLLTTRPDSLRAVQRVPHFDYDDENILAILHHLHDIPGTGTSFYRHIETGIERADKANAQTLRKKLQADGDRPDVAAAGFIGESNAYYEKIFTVEGRFNRLVMYQGCLLHSGTITPDFPFSSDPSIGRLTGNMFVQFGNMAVQ